GHRSPGARTGARAGAEGGRTEGGGRRTEGVRTRGEGSRPQGEGDGTPGEGDGTPGEGVRTQGEGSRTEGSAGRASARRPSPRQGAEEGPLKPGREQNSPPEGRSFRLVEALDGGATLPRALAAALAWSLAVAPSVFSRGSSAGAKTLG